MPKRQPMKKQRKSKPVRSIRTVPEQATMSCTRQFSLLNTNQTYAVYNTQLSQFARAVNVAKGYQVYRIKNIKLLLSPLADTFAATSGTTVPYAYFQVDRTRDLQNIRTSIEFKQLGCKPHRLDDKIIPFQWKPSVLNTTLDDAGTAAGVFNQYKVSPWIRCRDETGAPGTWNPDTTDHLGVVFFVENSGGALVNYKCEMVVEFEFAKPSYPTTITEGEPEPIELHTLGEDV